MIYQYIKALHIIFVVTWFAGLFYVPRLFIYITEAKQINNEYESSIIKKQLMVMAKRLLFGITLPSAIITLGFGVYFITIVSLKGWLGYKLIFVFLLYLYHISLHLLYNQLKSNNCKYTGMQLRLWNEVPTIILFSVVFLAVTKQGFSVWTSLVFLLGLISIILSATKVYAIIRERKKIKI